MMPLLVPQPKGRPLRVLALGAHADDLEIGCGATMLRLLAEHPGTQVDWVVCAAAGGRADEARTSAQAFCADAGTLRVTVHDLPESYLPAAWADLKARMQALEATEPDLVLTHHRADRHQDHRTVAELTWNSFRRHLVLEYEIPKYEGDLGHPNLFVAFDEALARRKVELLVEQFPSQAARPWFDPEVFFGLMRLRGSECGAAGRFAEAFHAPKVTV